MLPSVVITRPIVECSLMTLYVPDSAASVILTSWSYHGVVTILSLPSSNCPAAPFTMYPTQSTSLTEKCISSPRLISTASSGTNFGSEVIMVLPEPLCGNSSLALSLAYTSSMFGITSSSIKRLIKVDFPVRTGPTTPSMIDPFVRLDISL